LRLLLVEDDGALAGALAEQLGRHGFVVDHAAHREEAALLLSARQYAALILDLGLPDGDGLDLLRALRQQGQALPVIILTARAEINARIGGLDAGADDYMAKPFAPDELVARLRAILRRNGAFQGRDIVCSNLSFDVDAQTMRIDGDIFPLSQRESALLALLLRRLGLVVTKRLAEDQLFGATDTLGSNAIEVYVHRLRQKLQLAGARVEIITIRGVGYLLRAAP